MIAEIIEKDIKRSGRTSSPDIVLMNADYQETRRYHQRNIDNSIENWRFYFAKNPELGHGQYALDVVQRLQKQNRALVQYNFCKPTVDAQAGMLLQARFDPAFIPVNTEMTSLTEAIQKAFYSDKEMMDWNSSFLFLVTAGLIDVGCLKIVIDTRYSDLGNIGLEVCPPGTVMPDPWWKTDNSKDCKRVFQDVWLTTNEMMTKYPEIADKIQFWASRDKATGNQYGTNNGITPYLGDEQTSGSKYKIIQEYCVREKGIKTAYMLNLGGDIELPGNIPDGDMPSWLDANFKDENGYPTWNADYIYEKEKIVKVSHVRASCLSILSDEFLESKPTEVQIDATPFKFWSASRFNGETCTTIDAVKDAQRNFNYMQSMNLHKITTEGIGGAQFVDSSLFKTEEEYLRYNSDRGNPAATFRIKDGFLEKGVKPAIPCNVTATTGESHKMADQILLQYLPQISKVTPSTLGRPEQPQMSGILYSQLRTQSDVANYTINYGLRNFFNDLYEGWLIQASKTYANELVPRVFAVNGGREKITLNEHIMLEDGSEAIKNDASKLSEIRHKIIISERPDSPTEQMANVAVYSELFQSFSANPANAGTSAYLKNKLLSNLYQLNADEKEELEEIGDLELSLAVTTLETQLAQARVAKLQATQQAQQAEAQAAMMNQNLLPAPQGQAQSINQPQMAQPSEQTAPQVQGVMNG